MHQATPIKRVIVVVLDGLRPDAIDAFDLANIRRLMASNAWSLDARTVSPSVTSAAMTSLMSGVSPQRHGITSDRVFIPRQNGGLTALPELLATHGYPSSAFMNELPALFRGVASRVTRRLGFSASRFSGRDAESILGAARSTLDSQRRGLIVLHWPDADRAGHARGWMSHAYADGCRALDAAFGALVSATGLEHDDETMLIALADHGGGGLVANDHDSEHPNDRTIPLILGGPAIHAGELEAARLLDVPPTVLFALGVDVPASYEGRVLHEAFVAARVRATAVA